MHAAEDFIQPGELVRQVATGHVDLETRDAHGETALHIVLATNRFELAKMFLERGANVNVASNSGVTPLHKTVTRENGIEMLPLLLKYGADVFAKDNSGQNALHFLCLAPVIRVGDMARALMELGVSPHDKCYSDELQPLHLAAWGTSQELVKALLDYGADVNARSKDGSTPLLMAASIPYHDMLPILPTLLEHGANVHMKNIHGHTALHAACMFSQDKSIRALLSAGADVLVEDNDGNTPFSLIERDQLRMENPTIKLMIKALALKTVCLAIKLKDERIMRKYPELWSYYEDCQVCVYKMKCTIFIENYTYLDILVMSHNEIVVLMGNRDFQTNFWQHDLSRFYMYTKDVQRAFELAKYHHVFMLEQKNAINEAICSLPDVVVRKVMRYLERFDMESGIFKNCCRRFQS